MRGLRTRPLPSRRRRTFGASRADRRAAVLAGLFAALAPAAAGAQQPHACPAPLVSARRLVLVTADGMNASAARLRRYERGSAAEPWRPLGGPEPAMIGRAGMAWSPFFAGLRRDGEPAKVDGDKRAPAGIYRIGHSFGTVPSSRRGHLQVKPDTICVDDPASPAYNTITRRGAVGPRVGAENMSRALPMYRRGLLVDYPTDAGARAGSCIFIHVWRTPATATSGCVALPEARVTALQDFSEPGAVIAILPRAALDRLPGCLPADARRP
jgi:L,D-peptidoglycan transpeptidase YkuD (ErfK/YbiS/YcfS/YnhG family)